MFPPVLSLAIAAFAVVTFALIIWGAVSAIVKGKQQPEDTGGDPGP